ncbi:MAG: hypothetical protein WBM24_21220, partial [Candidatus Sulfotelmatobacter sp.]
MNMNVCLGLNLSQLEPALEKARTLPPAELPKLLGDLAEIGATAQARLSALAPVQTAADEWLTVAEACAKLH